MSTHPGLRPLVPAEQPASIGAARPSGDPPGRPVLRRERWEVRYRALVIGSDVSSVAAAVIAGNLLGFGTTIPWLGHVAPGVGILAGLLAVLGLVLCRAWDGQVLGQGAEEFSRVIRGVTTSAVALGLLGLAGEALAARPWVFGFIPVAGLLAIGGRLALRRRLHRLRADGRCALQALAVGTTESVTDLIVRTRRDHRRGWHIAGACTPSGNADGGCSEVLDVPVIGDLESVPAIARSGCFRIVAVCPTPALTPQRLHHLAWGLEDAAAELVVDPGLMEFAGPRLHIEPVDGLPLLRLTRPSFTGVSWLAKHMVDRLGALLLLLLLLIPLAFIAVAIKIDDPRGPVLFRQTRVGRHGRTFVMIKFRSMAVDAESRLRELAPADVGAGPLFKVRHDPRVTRVGAVLRRYSLDELPQLLNVLAGRMSLVGPRPPLPGEVVKFGQDARRRLLVRPGLTGLWQISGRSDLSWEQAVRLDLRYVENWSLALDAQILSKTLGAVVRSRGAY
ncbi:sugar transferase [Pseudonocardia lacus]|uniref:sugar transferase n=1 Tax=Pseudonocardia lacus TaxID=2835865 RepID=UPI0027E34232|nr:sugar transferase [Pseudonocardia lacus]